MSHTPPKVYTNAASTRAAALILAAAPTVLLVLMLIVVLVRGLPLLHTGMLLVVLLAIPGWLWVYTVSTARIVLHADRIERINIFGTKSVAAETVAGYRSSWQPGVIVLMPKDEKGPALAVPEAARLDSAGQAWLTSLPDLDETLTAPAYEHARSDPRFGATEPARTAFVTATRESVKFINIAAWAVAFLGVLLPWPRTVAIALLTLFPLGALAYAARVHPLVRIAVEETKSRPLTLVSPFIACWLALSFRSLRELYLLNPFPLAIPAVIAAVALAVAARRIDSKLRRDATAAWTFGIFAFAFYTGSAAGQFNELADPWPSRTYETIVEEVLAPEGRPTEYRLNLRPWGDGERDTGLAVPQHVHDSLAAGDRICITVHPGALAATWYEVERCSTSPALRGASTAPPVASQ